MPHSTLEERLLAALAYGDIFDYPLTLSELARYQVGTEMPARVVEATANALVSASEVEEVGGLYALRGRAAIAEVRRSRERASARIWRRALAYSGILARLPFVRMVAVTGALAVSNINGRADIDLLVLTEPRRVWICRRFLVGLVRVGRLFGDDICPNYILSANHLELDQRDFFTAHELTQMIPLCGPRYYRAILQANAWVWEYLPAARTPQAAAVMRARVGARSIETVLRMRAFDRWEEWEMLRLRRQIRREIGEHAEVVCSPHQCKGHTGLHRQWILERLAQRLDALGMDRAIIALSTS